MILPLRQRHRRMVIALGIFLPVAFVVGIAARKSVPAVAQLPVALVGTAQKFEMIEWERADLFAKRRMQVRLLRDTKDAARFAIAFAGAKNFVKPDLLVYWVAGNRDITGTLPAKAILLGSFSAAALPLSDEVAKSSGTLILYSLADDEIVDVSKPVQFNDSTQ
jgi:hypothetical protein